VTAINQKNTSAFQSIFLLFDFIVPLLHKSIFYLQDLLYVGAYYRI